MLAKQFTGSVDSRFPSDRHRTMFVRLAVAGIVLVVLHSSVAVRCRAASPPTDLAQIQASLKALRLAVVDSFGDR